VLCTLKCGTLSMSMTGGGGMNLMGNFNTTLQ
jgi:hypothetical protein